MIAIISFVVNIIKGKKRLEKDEHEIFLGSDTY